MPFNTCGKLGKPLWLLEELAVVPGEIPSDVSCVQQKLPASFLTLDDCRIALDLKLTFWHALKPRFPAFGESFWKPASVSFPLSVNDNEDVKEKKHSHGSIPCCREDKAWRPRAGLWTCPCLCSRSSVREHLRAHQGQPLLSLAAPCWHSDCSQRSPSQNHW